MSEKKNRIGSWSADGVGLPVYRLTAELPLTRGLAPGEPEVPLFLLGNHGLTAFVHADGGYQLHTGERAWAQLNPGETRPGAACSSAVIVNGMLHDLRTTAAVEREFGCGFAQMSYEIGDCRITRELSTPPSRRCGERRPVLFITLKVRNAGEQAAVVAWEESVSARYDFSFRHNYPYTGDRLDYPVRTELGEDGKRLTAGFEPRTTQPLVLNGPLEPAWQECYPPTVHLAAVTGDFELSEELRDEFTARLVAQTTLELGPGEEQELRLAVGYSQEDLDWPAVLADARDGVEEAFRSQWRAIIPGWEDPRDPDLAQEMRWHFYVLQAMATWSAWYEETFIPQGTVYEYGLGVAAVIRDHLQHAMPLCYCDPELAASILRYTAKHTDPWGHIKHGDEGANQFPLGADQKSDSQIYALYTLAEYLRAGNPLDELLKPLHFLGSDRETDLLDCAARWVRYLRDTVSTGAHGFVRLLCSDWNDCFYGFFKDLPYSKIFHDAESGLNTAMAIVALERLGGLLSERQAELPDIGDRKADLANLAAACLDLSAGYTRAIAPFLEERDFLVRAIVDGEFDVSNEAFADEPQGARNRVVGLDEMFFEPQPHLLALHLIYGQEAGKIWQAIRERVYDDEPCGARQREKAGVRENGGIWFALNGPLVDALAEHDPEAAREALEKLTCRRRAEIYPDRWIGQWSCGDSINSHNLADAEQAGRVASYLHPMPVYCAHAHAWPLHGWLRLRALTDS